MSLGLGRLMVRLVVTGALSAVLVVACDTLFAVAGAPTAFGLGGGFRLVAALAVLALIPGALVGFAQGILAGGVLGAPVRKWFRWVRQDAERDREAAAWVIATTIGAGVFAIALVWVSVRLFTFPQDAPARPGAVALRAIVMGGVALFLGAATAMATWTMARVARAAMRWMPERWRMRFPLTWTALLLVAVGTVAVSAAILLPRLELFAGWDLRLLAWAAVLFGVQAGLLWLWSRYWPKPKRRRTLVGVVLFGAALVSVPVVVTSFSDPALLSLVMQRGSASRKVLSAWRWVLDRDGDGYASLLGGGDCDDGNASVHPGARDIAGNGIDEDCSGGDAAPPKAIAKPAPKRRRRTGMNFVLVTIDTLRADHVGAYGYSRKTTPRLDSFARTGVVFERAYAPANHTPRSIPALLTGRYPSRIRWHHRSNYPPLAKGQRTLATELKAGGYRTVGVFPHWYFRKRRNLHAGFDTWDLTSAPATDDGSRVTAPQVTRRAIRHLKRLAKDPSPFFLWVHYYDPHHPYVVHEGVRRFGGRMKDRYDGEIRFVDGYVGRLLRALREVGAAGNTAVVVTSDHGEAFGEHRNYWHGHALYDEQVRIPLIVRAPGIAAGRVSTPVSTVDAAPTILHLAGLAAPEGLDGRSLVGLAKGTDATPRPVFVELLAYPSFPRTMRAVIVGRLKLIHDINENHFELFDLTADPKEQDDRLARHTVEADRLKAILRAFVDGSELASLNP